MSTEAFYPSVSSQMSEKAGIVLLNHIGSCVAQDTGRDAQFLANTTNLTVIAADRPGSGFCIPSPALGRRLAADYVSGMSKTGTMIGKIASDHGISSLIVAGRSAGATGALSLARAEVIPITSVYAAEPIGLYATNVFTGRNDYKTYISQQKKLIKDRTSYPDLIRPHGSDVRLLAQLTRLGSIAICLPLDQYHNQTVWNKTVSLLNAQYIAEEMVDTCVRLDFAQYSMSMPRQIYIKSLVEVLPILRAEKSDTPFEAERVPDTVHASFDNRAFFAQRLQPLVQRELTR